MPRSRPQGRPTRDCWRADSVFGGLGPIGVLLSVSLVTTVVGCAVSNNAVVILMFPICQTLAANSGLCHARQLLVVLLVGASSSFCSYVIARRILWYSPGRLRPATAKFGLMAAALHGCHKFSWHILRKNTRFLKTKFFIFVILHLLHLCMIHTIQ